MTAPASTLLRVHDIIFDIFGSERLLRGEQVL